MMNRNNFSKEMSAGMKRPRSGAKRTPGTKQGVVVPQTKAPKGAQPAYRRNK